MVRSRRARAPVQRVVARRTEVGEHRRRTGVEQLLLAPPPPLQLPLLIIIPTPTMRPGRTTTMTTVYGKTRLGRMRSVRLPARLRSARGSGAVRLRRPRLLLVPEHPLRTAMATRKSGGLARLPRRSDIARCRIILRKRSSFLYASFWHKNSSSAFLEIIYMDP